MAFGSGVTFTSKNIGNCILEVKTNEGNDVVYILFKNVAVHLQTLLKIGIFFILCTYQSSLFVTAMHCKTQPFFKKRKRNFLNSEC